MSRKRRAVFWRLTMLAYQRLIYGFSEENGLSRSIFSRSRLTSGARAEQLLRWNGVFIGDPFDR